MNEPGLDQPRLDRPEPWTEADYLALGETSNRIELIDGGLWMSPGPTWPHQDISWQLVTAVRPAARTARLLVAGGPVNVRLAPNRIVIPDFVVKSGERRGLVTDAAEVVLVGAVTSPSNAAADRVLKKVFYAAAGIKWYLLVEPELKDYESVRLQLFRLEGDHYVEHATAEYGETLTSDEPFPIEIRTEGLLEF